MTQENLKLNSLANADYELPDRSGHFGQYGGRYVAETLMPLILSVEEAYNNAKDDPDFWAEFNDLAKNYIGRPSPLYFAEKTTNHLSKGDKGAKIYFKREELNHTGAHKINHCIGQILLAKRMGKTRIIAETGAGQHGVATATVCALFDIPCTIFMGAKDVERQAPNVFRMKLLGAEVKSVTAGSQSLKDAMNEAMRDWVSNVNDTYYLIGTVGGPHPFPMMVRDFQSIIGKELREQMIEREGRMADTIIACIGGGSNAIGIFHPFLNDDKVNMIGVEAAGMGVNTDKHAASLNGGRAGILHGMQSYFLQDSDGQIQEAHSISAGLDYPGIGPEHAWLFDQKRVNYVSITDDEALKAFQICAKLEGIIPALESAHAYAHILKIAGDLPKDHIIVLNLSGRGDKDIYTVAEKLGVKI